MLGLKGFCPRAQRFLASCAVFLLVAAPLPANPAIHLTLTGQTEGGPAMSFALSSKSFPKDADIP